MGEGELQLNKFSKGILERHIDNKVYIEYKEEIRNTNLVSLQKLSFLGMVGCVVLAILSLPPIHILGLFNGYISLALLFTSVHILTITLLKTYKRFIVFTYYILYIFVMTIAILMGTFWGVHSNATTFILIMIIIPMFIIDKPYRINIVCIVISVVFCYVAIKVKSGEILNIDITNSIVFCITSCILSYRSIVAKMQEIMRTKDLEHKLLLEKALKKSEMANQAKTEFLSRMSHDIRTPMNAIIGMTKLAQNEDNSPNMKDYLDNIDSSSKFLLGLINDILDLSKIESGQIILNPEPCDIEDFENAVNNVIRPLMEAKNIEFIFEMQCGATCLVLDKLRFEQIFFNLLSNAVKFTPEGGKVEFIAEHLPPKDELYGARFIVRDNGVGMSDEFLNHLFEAFTQEKTYHISNNEGTGLGLPIVKSLVEAMTGNISVNSAIGKGTEFVIDLYFPEVENPPHQINDIEMKGYLENSNILLVEDNELNILVAKKLLEKKKSIVTILENGEEAVNAFKVSAIGYYDAILMDVRMPIMDGIEATQVIRGMDRVDAKDIPIIAMTADAFSEERKKTLEAGMNAHLSKPIDPKVMYETIERYINERKNRE